MNPKKYHRNFQSRSNNQFFPDDSTQNLLGFSPGTMYEKYKLSPKPVDIISFDKIFPETDFAQRLIFKGKRAGTNHKI